jgi:hypothetical protein
METSGFSENHRMAAGSLDRLADWYAEQTDGEWEHGYGITLSTLDNPGWLLEVDLADTELAGRVYPRIEEHRSETDWIVGYVEEARFRVACGPRNLKEAVDLFLTWVSTEREARS